MEVMRIRYVHGERGARTVIRRPVIQRGHIQLARCVSDLPEARVRLVDHALVRDDPRTIEAPVRVADGCRARARLIRDGAADLVSRKVVRKARVDVSVAAMLKEQGRLLVDWRSP